MVIVFLKNRRVTDKLFIEYIDQLKFFKICLNVFIIFFISILILQEILVPFSPKLTAIATSLFHPLFSILFSLKILDNSFNYIISYILTLHLWKKLRQLFRVSYVFHIVIYHVIKLSLSQSFLDNVPYITIFILTFTSHYFVCSLINNRYEKKGITFLESVSNHFFK